MTTPEASVINVRRVRCDRSRPHCERCTKTGRTCDGYHPGTAAPDVDVDESQLSTPSTPRPNSLATRISPSGPISSLDAQVHRSLHYFQTRTAYEFAGYFHNDLWSTLVLQISRREECVRQMVVALGLLHESFHIDHAKVIEQSPARSLRRQAISQYARGVSLLNRHISTQGWSGLEITLLCSILCVAFEWLRGDYPSGYKHLWSTLSIISQWQDKDTVLTGGTSFWSPSGHLIRNKLRPLCTSLVLQARTMPADPQLPTRSLIDIRSDIKSFSNLEEAKNSLDITLAYILPETIARKPSNYAGGIRQWDLALHLARWSQYFNEYLETVGSHDKNTPRAIIMKLWHVAARILFTASLSEDETNFDSFLPEFRHIVTCVEALVFSAASLTSNFSVDIGVVPLLYYVGLKCRHPDVRRRAIGILEVSPRREAVWDSIGAALVTRELVRVEEEGLGVVCVESDIPGSARVCNMHIITDVEHRRIVMKTKRQGTDVWGCEKVLCW
ncbi:Fc.00g106090.m01.CDS01 [Cosmosporella sp. VM-42]